MLSDVLKEKIQSAYRRYLSEKELKPRAGQRIMIAEIAKTLGQIETDEENHRTSDNHIAVVQAGTGTGKTVAYSLAAIPVALAMEKKLVIATATVALQEQILFKDLPDIAKHSGLNFSFALAKGRGRYVCLQQLHQAGDDGGIPDFFPELAAVNHDDNAQRLIGRLVDALDKRKWNGERDAWPEVIPDQTWQTLTIDHARCGGKRCDYFDDCAFFKARNALHSADVVVANHDIVLADLALGGGAILPPTDETVFIFDEAHHLPVKALEHFAQFARLNLSQKWLDDAAKMLSSLAEEVGELALMRKPIALVPEWNRDIKQQIGICYGLIEQCVQLGDVVASGEGEGYLRFKLGRVPEPVRQAFQDLTQYTTKWLNLVSDIKDALNEAIEKPHPDISRSVAEKWAPIVALTLLRFESVAGLFQAYAVQDQADVAPHARWFKILGGFDQDIELFASPILAGPLLFQHLWSRCHGAVLTSATLTALGKFDRFRSHAGLSQQYTYQALPSPFDYSEVAEIRVPKQACDPKEVERHTQAICDYVNQNWNLSVGTLVLFSSRKQMEEVLLRLDAEVKTHVLAQNQMSKQELVRLHKKSVDAGDVSVIFGLASFAEGIDLPGEYCEHVIITRLPFAVPDQPLESALSEWIEHQGRNAFMEISVPDAAIRLTQACGRLIRNEQDKGRVSVLDRRLVSSGYGRRILDSLPPFRRVIE